MGFAIIATLQCKSAFRKKLQLLLLINLNLNINYIPNYYAKFTLLNRNIIINILGFRFFYLQHWCYHSPITVSCRWCRTTKNYKGRKSVDELHLN